jgi:hypothetical protein
MMMVISFLCFQSIGSAGEGIDYDVNLPLGEGSFELTTWSIGSDSVMLKTSRSAEWSPIETSASPDYDMRGDICPLYGTDQYLYSTASAEHYYILDLDNDTWFESDIPNPSTYYSQDLAPIHGTDEIFIMYEQGGPNGPIFSIYDRSEGSFTPLNLTIPQRHAAVISPFHGIQKVLLFGGDGGIYPNNIRYNDTWIYDVGTDGWSMIDCPVSPPSERYYQGICPIWGTDRIIMYGGLGAETDSDTWVFDLSESKWTKVVSTIMPPSRNFVDIAPIIGTPLVIVFGGWNGNTYLDDTWIFDSNTNEWREVPMDTKPEPSNENFLLGMDDTGDVLLWEKGFDWLYRLSPATYVSEGAYITDPLFLGTNVTVKTIGWTGTTPNGTFIDFQIRSADSPANLSLISFSGPDYSAILSYTDRRAAIDRNLTSDGWLQIRFHMKTLDVSTTPVLRDVMIDLDHMPRLTNITPRDVPFTNGTLRFGWSYFDEENSTQAGVEFLFSKDRWDFKVENVLSVRDYDATNLTIREFNLTDGTWFWKMRVMDSAGTWSFLSEMGSFVLDRTPPKSNISAPMDMEMVDIIDQVSGFATDKDGSGLSSVWICIRSEPDGLHFNGTHFVQPETWLNTSGLQMWSYHLRQKLPDGQYTILSRAVDWAGNHQSAYGRSDIYYDGTPPSMMSISINGGSDETNTTSVVLSIRCEDPSKPLMMSFSENSKLWTEWTNYTQTMPFNLSSGNGNKTVFFRAKDSMGNVAQPVNDTIFLNITLPDIDKGGTKGDENNDMTSIIIPIAIGLFALFLIVALILFFLARKRSKDRFVKELSSRQDIMVSAPLVKTPASLESIFQSLPQKTMPFRPGPAPSMGPPQPIVSDRVDEVLVPGPDEPVPLVEPDRPDVAGEDLQEDRPVTGSLVMEDEPDEIGTDPGSPLRGDGADPVKKDDAPHVLLRPAVDQDRVTQDSVVP